VLSDVLRRGLVQLGQGGLGEPSRIALEADLEAGVSVLCLIEEKLGFLTNHAGFVAHRAFLMGLPPADVIAIDNEAFFVRHRHDVYNDNVAEWRARTFFPEITPNEPETGETRQRRVCVNQKRASPGSRKHPVRTMLCYHEPRPRDLKTWQEWAVGLYHCYNNVDI